MSSPKKPLFYRIRDMAPYILSGDYKNTFIVNPYDECFELDLLLNQLCFHYSFANCLVRPGLNAILFCQAHCLRPSVQQTVAIAGFTRSHDLLPFTPVIHTGCFLVIKRDTPPSLLWLSITQTLNGVPRSVSQTHLAQYLQSIPYPGNLIQQLCDLPVTILNPRSDFYGQLTAYLEFSTCWLCEQAVENTGRLPTSCVQRH
jgi:hypothetical protein